MFDHPILRQLNTWLQNPLSFYLHVLVFLVAVAANVTGANSPIVNFILLIWVVLLGIHGLSFDSSGARAVKYSEKPKRHRLELGDDGELVEIVDEDEKSKRSLES